MPKRKAGPATRKEQAMGRSTCKPGALFPLLINLIP